MGAQRASLYFREALLLKHKDALSRSFNGGSLCSRSEVPPRSPRASARCPSYPTRGTLFGRHIFLGITQTGSKAGTMRMSPRIDLARLVLCDKSATTRRGE